VFCPWPLGVANGISKGHQAFLNNGGLGQTDLPTLPKNVGYQGVKQTLCCCKERFYNVPANIALAPSPVSTK